ncbi:hypothetical protein LCGC14_0664680 [marine sediment metagenome]|uniref:Uncharacterized protein n=1 Tax=marine sediment metagenome TaxID=412755 RepID=A0A0F9RCN2_9ZZZZ
MNISIERKIGIIGSGIISTIIILLMLEVVYAQIISDTILNNLDDNTILLIIVSGLFIFTLIISVAVSLIITQDIKRTKVLRSSILSLIITLIILFMVSNITLILFYPVIFSELGEYYELLLIFPQVLIYFGVFILGDIFNLFFFTIIVYYVLFVYFLEKQYVMRDF